LLILKSRVSGTASAEVDDENRRCRPGSPATGLERFASSHGDSHADSLPLGEDEDVEHN